MTKLVIDFNLDGTVEAMHKDTFSLAFLGDMEVTRASDIRFNPATQLWDLYVFDKTGGVFELPSEAAGFPGYEAARVVEVEWLNDCRLYGISPFSAAAALALVLLRTARSGRAPTGPGRN